MTRTEIVAKIHSALDHGDAQRANIARAQLRALDAGKTLGTGKYTPGPYRPSCSYWIEQQSKEGGV